MSLAAVGISRFESSLLMLVTNSRKLADSFFSFFVNFSACSRLVLLCVTYKAKSTLQNKQMT